MLYILKNLSNNKQYDHDIILINDLIKRISNMLNNNDMTDDFLDQMNNDLNYLDQKYEDLYDLINLFDPVRFELKRKNHINYVENLREENRKRKKIILDSLSYIF